MKMICRRGLLFVLPLVALLAGAVWGADASRTVVTIDGMHCQSCAKKIDEKLRAVPGVEVAQTNAQSASALIDAQPRRTLSPRALWEAVEKAGFKPVKLSGPSGTFTAKPAM